MSETRTCSECGAELRPKDFLRSGSGKTQRPDAARQDPDWWRKLKHRLVPDSVRTEIGWALGGAIASLVLALTMQFPDAARGTIDDIGVLIVIELAGLAVSLGLLVWVAWIVLRAGLEAGPILTGSVIVVSTVAAVVWAALVVVHTWTLWVRW